MLGISTPLLVIPELILIFAGIIVYFLPFINIGIVTGFTTAASFWWLTVIVISFFLGRVYCSHICPMSGVFSFISYVTKNREVLSAEYPRFVGYFFTTLWLTSSVYVLIRFVGNIAGFLPFEAVYSQPSVVLFYSLYAGSAILARTVAKSTIEHYICPISPYMITGIKLSTALNVPAFHFEVQKDNCKSCKVCISQNHCLMNNDVKDKINNCKMNFEECLNCGACVEMCKFKTVTYGFSKRSKK